MRIHGGAHIILMPAVPLERWFLGTDSRARKARKGSHDIS